MPDPKSARLKAPDPRMGAKRRAAIMAFLGTSRPELSDPDANYPSAMERARAAYDAETGEFNPNFINSILKARPRDVKNWLVNMARGVAENPLSALAPAPTRAVRAGQLTRAARLKAYRGHRAAYDQARAKEFNQFMARQRSGFEANLEPPPARITPRREYVVEQRGRGVDVFDAAEAAPEQITLEQARAAGVVGPEQMPLPSTYRFTRRGLGVDVFER